MATPNSPVKNCVPLLRRSSVRYVTREKHCFCEAVAHSYRRFPPAVGCLLGLLVLLTGCAGYQIGTQSLYPSHIRTVYVPIFESTSFRRNLGERLTEAVAKEIELKTPYKVVGDPAADSILTGRIVGEGKRVVGQAPSGEAREVETTIRVEISWLDRQGSAIRRNEAISLPAELVAVSSTGTFVPEVGQSVATAHQQAIHRMAEQIVGLMENPW